MKKRRDEAPPVVRCKVGRYGDVVELGPDHSDIGTGHIFLMQAFGTANEDFSHGLLSQLANVVGRGQTVNASDLNRVAAVGFSITRGENGCTAHCWPEPSGIEMKDALLF